MTLVAVSCAHCGTIAQRRVSEVNRARNIGGKLYCGVVCLGLSHRGKPKNPIPQEERFWAKVNKTEGCWLWTANQQPFGHGLFYVTGDRNHQAHRVSWEMAYGRIPPGMQILHKCDNPPCVRPDHLFIGTPADNVTDMIMKGRRRSWEMAGSRNPFSKLTEEQANEIRMAFLPRSSGKSNSVELAQRFGVSGNTIRAIAGGVRWSHLGPLDVIPDAPVKEATE